MGLLHRAAGRPMPANIGEPELLDSQAGHVTGLTSTQYHHTRPKPPDPGSIVRAVVHCSEPRVELPACSIAPHALATACTAVLYGRDDPKAGPFWGGGRYLIENCSHRCCTAWGWPPVNF